MRLTPLGSEFESVIAATFLFLAGGAISFMCCFCVTHTYLWHKRRILRNRLRHEWSEDTDTDTDFRIIHRPHQRSTRLLHQYQYNQKLKCPTTIETVSYEKRPSFVSEQQRRSTIGQNTVDKGKNWAQPNKNVVFECGNSGTEETNSS